MGESVRDGLEENGKGKTRAQTTPPGQNRLRGGGLKHVAGESEPFNHSDLQSLLKDMLSKRVH